VLALVLFAIRSSLAIGTTCPPFHETHILEGDRVYVNKLAYDLKSRLPLAYRRVEQPRRGDIVVFYSPYDGQRLVKRVIGCPATNSNSVRSAYPQWPASRLPANADKLLRDVSARIARVMSSPANSFRSNSCCGWLAGVRAMRDFGPIQAPQGTIHDGRQSRRQFRFPLLGWQSIAKKSSVAQPPW